MRYYVVNQNYCWADEIDFNAVWILPQEKWDKFCLKVDKLEFPIEAFVGTNEDILFESAREYLETFKVSNVIEEEDFKVLQKVFHTKKTEIQMGNVLNLLDYADDEDEN